MRMIAFVLMMGLCSCGSLKDRIVPLARSVQILEARINGMSDSYIRQVKGNPLLSDAQKKKLLSAVDHLRNDSTDLARQVIEGLAALADFDLSALLDLVNRKVKK